MKVIITVAEAMERNIWPDILKLFGRDAEEEMWPGEEFILTEEQAKRLGLLQ
ncbi:hypothetical protein [Paenibacillus methanolicus]|uniref:Uncharacterized protein n=1 Tax=Paenibacillus methanolicus TaxID=582686 RepID=A0A5S5C7W2_9BACL|nr:hypothetical protein [Paenibacillus methanolicus]TYP75495.1 hypothetical protein BCM02_104172 [Paenibacillus methanolicus]